MATHYNSSSRGPVEIAGMPLRHARNALAKLQRDEPWRLDEIEALTTHVTRLQAEEAEASQ